MKILVTGATGFIGRYVINELKNYDCEIVATARRTENLPEHLIDNGISYIPCDISEDRTDFFNYLSKPDILIHLAWDGLPNYKGLFHYETNLPVHYNFLKKMIQGGLRHLVVAGTCFEYGMQSGCLSETLSTEPANPYGLAKDVLRKFLEQLACEHPFVFQWVRLFYMYGEGQSKTSLLSQLDKAIDNGDEVFNMSGGEQIRDYLPVEKVARIIVKISLQNKINGIVNCCSGKPVTIRKLVEDHVRNTGEKINLNLGYYPYPDYEPFAFWGDNSKLRTVS
ncbi:NAD-dependent epimerase/dehydratase family protein [Desulfoluna spongiiphila]|uniref:dTDP-6-deoxy-L-talose 4-dehydrogenase (NAD+) n=1 Tax=Desulfoluna spongiiphila TaxID=419481 RepID=A0A1G5JFM4_9BACT|nr:NAD(P)-dependent oxidoreductase [Desulfoluna spongiiphila]SCY87097.1 dTDP-6-deoxy-L-talose 4-dehydrogenase (NAD+) [Desulfoluna spongiiphila]